VVNKTVHLVFLGEPWDQPFFVLADPSVEVVRDSYVEYAGLAGHDVDVILELGAVRLSVSFFMDPSAPSLRSFGRDDSVGRFE